MAVHSTLRAVKSGKVIASFSPGDICSDGEMMLTSSCVRYIQNKEDPSRSSPVTYPLFTAQMETGSGADPYVVRVQNSVEGSGRATAERGIKRTSWIPVRSALAVVGDRWLPVVVTRRTVDPADKKVEKSTSRLDDALPTQSSEPRRTVTVAIGIAGVSPLTIPQSCLVGAAGVMSLGRLFRHRTRVGGGCGKVG